MIEMIPRTTARLGWSGLRIPVSESEVIWALTWKNKLRIMTRCNWFIEIAILYAVTVSVNNSYASIMAFCKDNFLLRKNLLNSKSIRSFFFFSYFIMMDFVLLMSNYGLSIKAVFECVFDRLVSIVYLNIVVSQGKM
jgi:hypothetical protein